MNTKPLIYGLDLEMMKEQAELIIDYPSKIASMLLKDEIDVGLVPVAIIPEMKEYHIKFLIRITFTFILRLLCEVI